MSAEIILYDTFKNEWIRFRKPVQTLTAFSKEEVPAVLETIMTVVEKDHYAAGFISYEAAPAFDPALTVNPVSTFPLCWFTVYQSIESIHLEEYKKQNYELGEWVPSIGENRYRRDIRKIKDYIASGDTYQVNYTYRMSSTFSGDPFSFFLDLNDNQKTRYAAFLDIGDFAICSVSPELFFQLEGTTIISKPMKGTAPRGRFFSEDMENASWLHRSLKNRAENIMIVDMIRNDLSRIAETGSVTVQSLYDIERYQTAYQMTSTVKAETTASISRIMGALFPCASITGAPKPRTMEIIAELETTPRKLYTGCIGFMAPGRKAQFNVAIRTVIIDRKSLCAEYGIGGGIVWDSDETGELEESLTKAKVLTERRPAFELLETMLWQPRQGYFLLDYHLERLKRSAVYFDYAFDEKKIKKKLERLASNMSRKARRVRLLLAQNGRITCRSVALHDLATRRPIRLKISPFRVDSRNPYLYHKTTYRDLYENARKQGGDCDDIVLVNERGEITESSIYNIVIKQNGRLLTPALSSGLLPGTLRAWLLDQNIVLEKIITMGNLRKAEELFLINSVRKWQKAVLV